MYWLPYSSYTSHHLSQTSWLKNWCSTHARFSKSSLKHSIRFCDISFKFKTEFYGISFFLTSRVHFQIHQLWQSGFSMVYSNCCCSCSFKSEIIKIGQSSHKIYSNNIVNFQESTTILNALTKKCLETYRMFLVSTTTSGVSGTGSNINEGALHTPQSSRTGTSSLYVV